MKPALDVGDRILVCDDLGRALPSLVEQVWFDAGRLWYRVMGEKGTGWEATNVLRMTDEDITWCRGWNGPVADAFRTTCILS